MGRCDPLRDTRHHDGSAELVNLKPNQYGALPLLHPLSQDRSGRLRTLHHLQEEPVIALFENLDGEAGPAGLAEVSFDEDPRQVKVGLHVDNEGRLDIEDLIMPCTGRFFTSPYLFCVRVEFRG